MNEDLMTRHPDQANAKGGTEMMQERIYSAVPRELLEKFQIWFSRYDEGMVDNSKIQLLYVHDLPGDPMYQKTLSEEGRKRFAKILFVSNWQMQKFMDFYGLKWSECMVVRNAIDTIDCPFEKPVKDRVKLIYHTTPHRGLNILAGIWPTLSQSYPVELDVFSSFRVYGWPQRDAQYEQLFQFLRDQPNVTYHGAAPNETVRDALKDAHIFAYPSTWVETSCIALMEAMSAGTIPVHSNLGALGETSAGLTVCYQMDENIEKHANVFYGNLAGLIEAHMNHPTAITNMRFQIKSYATHSFNMLNRSQEWIQLLSALAQSHKVA
jgi:glycosyltransferase involved in cell wall biosynthesis